MAKTQIKNYVFKPGIGAADNLAPNAYSLLERNKTFIQKEATAWLQDQIDSGVPAFSGYTYNDEKCERDIGFNIDAYLSDIRYGGNESTYNVVKYYWDQDVSQIDGTRAVEVAVYNFINDLVTTYILRNTAYSAINTEATQIIDLTKTAEVSAIDKVGELITVTRNVIESGLDQFPTFEENGYGRIKIQGRYDLDELLLITNATKNEIIYNFSNPSTGGLVSIKTDNVLVDPDFPSYLQTTDGITTIRLNYNTSSHSATDELQIFVEQIENGKSVVTTRPYDFGTDAIERMRVAQPLSMLDADFEYGLQPTKWAAISTLRGYPSVYEIPGTDTSVISVTTDASAGTEGVGQSLITVTTVGPHNLLPGSPITIKALEDAVIGAARAEGSFVIVETPTPETFTYYAKSKVGTTSGDVLSTTYTQLRQAGFYTGSSIGNAKVTVASNGSAGTMVTELAVEAGENIIPFDGDTPEIGSPITDASGALPLGTQVTGVLATSAGGGTYITPELDNDFSAGSASVTVVDATGVVSNLAVDRGDGTAIYVVSVSGGNTINFSGEFTQNLTGNNVIYSEINGVNQNGAGTDAWFNVQRNGGIYTVELIAGSGGNGFAIGDRFKIPGTDLGGLSPQHDLTIIVESIISDSSIDTFSFEGTAFDGTGSLTSVIGTVDGGAGTGATFDVSYSAGTFTNVTLSNDTGEGYTVEDRIKILGTQFGVNGIDGTNDLIIRVTGIDSVGKITSLAFDGVAPDAIDTVTNPPYTTTSVSGVGAQFSVTYNGTTYTNVSFSNAGSNYLPGETISVLGTDLNGVSPTNDLLITIDNVDGTGAITDVSLTGVASNAATLNSISGTNVIGTGASFAVDLAAGSYTVTLETGGTDYGVGQTIIIPGSQLIGEDVVNDLEIVITGTDAADPDNVGVITTFTDSGTAAGGSASYTYVTGEIEQPIGTNATFTITRENGTYSSIVNVNGGNDYKIGNRIIINGSQLGGEDGVNDVEIRILTVDLIGAITDFIETFESAAIGSSLDLISTFTTSEFAAIPLAQNSALSFSEIATLETTFTNAHGLVPGSTFIVTIDSDDGVNNHDLAAGSYIATDIPSVNRLRFQARAPGTIDTATSEIIGTVYPRPDSFFVHRPYDGGVQLGTGGPQHGAQAIRQSKKYIRYQSGKGIMYTTGALFAPSYDLRSVVAEDIEVGSLITVVTDDNDHGVQEGGIVRLLGIETPGYNSGPETAVPPQFDYEVVNVIDERTFQIRAQRRLGSTTAILGFGAQMSVVRWHGATVRSGIFDDQNGIFWEFDGTQISVVQRTGTRQLAGTIAMQVDNNLITGTNTRFRDQLKAGDRIIVKGMTHVVSHVNSQTECTVTPDWRGVVNIQGAKANLIVDKKVKQSEFNLDRLDGTGPSGYEIDLAKMQMIGIQYSWYGAGFIDFMLRGADGNFVYAHRMRNSNVNTEAFMRSGNLPVRYEVTNEGPSGKLVDEMDATQITVPLEDSSFFPDSGTLYIDNEIIVFTGNDKTTNTLTGCTRAATFTNFQAGATRNYTAGPATTHADRTGVILISQTITPLISHWGSAFITDGLFDEDRGYIFSYAETGLEVSTTPATAFMIRLSPSVSNALVGDLGERELLNRAQLLLQSIEITSDGVDGTANPIQGGIVVQGILNPQNYPLDVNNVTWSTLSSQAQGGQPSFAQVASSGAIIWSQDATTVVETPLTAAFPNGNVSIAARPWNGRFIENNSRYILFTTTNLNLYIDNGLSTNDYISHPNLPANTQIRRLNAGTFNSGGTNYTWVELSQNGQGNNTSSGAATVQKRYNLSNTSRIWFNQASWESAGIVAGTISTDSAFSSANTSVNSVTRETFFGTVYYDVTFTSSYTGTINPGTTTVEFTFEEAVYALPGETIFSFIAQPGERATADFSELKELTNTPLGGRGTYPNGPDVLAINVYKVAGAPSNVNVILNWGEAQA